MLISRFFATALAAPALVALCCTVPAPAYAQTYQFDNGGVFSFTRPSSGASTVFITGNVVNPADGIIEFTVAFGPTRTDSVNFNGGFGFAQDLGNFVNGPANIPGGTFTGNIFQLGLAPTTLLGTYTFETGAFFRTSASDFTRINRVVTFSVTNPVTAVPEPGEWAIASMLCAGLVGLIARRRLAPCAV